MRTLAFLALASIAFGACATPSLAIVGANQDPAARAAILTTIDRFFEAMAARDQAAFAATMTGDGVVHSQVLRDGRWQLRARSMTDCVAGLAQGSGRLLETYWQPTVLQRGPIATVWTPYRFRIDATDSHFGVDIFTLVQVDGAWRIASALYTVEPAAGTELAPAAGAEIRPASLR